MAYIGVDLGSTNIKAALYITDGQRTAHTVSPGDNEVSQFQNPVCFETGIRKIGLKSAFSIK
jgi:sugar (pentulose or hexulose) kinase